MPVAEWGADVETSSYFHVILLYDKQFACYKCCEQAHLYSNINYEH